MARDDGDGPEFFVSVYYDGDEKSSAARGSETYREKADRVLRGKLEKLRDMLGCAEESAPARKTSKTEEPKCAHAPESVKGSAARQNAASVDGIHKGHRARLRLSARRDRELDAFSEVEILETLLSFVIPQKDTNLTAHRLLDRFGTLSGVMRAPCSELAKTPNVTRNAAELIPMLPALYMWDGKREIRLSSHAAVAEFFGSMFRSVDADGTYAAYLDAGFGLIAVEKSDAELLRGTVGSACKYSAEYVVVSQTTTELYPPEFNMIEKIDKLAEVLRYVGVRLLDYMVFTSAGYFTLGSSAARRDGCSEYLFVPTGYNSPAYDLIKKLETGIGDDDE